MEQLFKDFCKQWMRVVNLKDDNTPLWEDYKKFGVCKLFNNYAHTMKHEDAYKSDGYLIELFSSESLDITYPFDREPPEVYIREHMDKTMQHNLARYMFVERHAGFDPESMLKAFAKEYISAIDSDKLYLTMLNKKTDYHIGRTGTCTLFTVYAQAIGGYSYAERHKEFLRSLFVKNGMDEAYPFGGSAVYINDRIDHRLHLDQDRIAFYRSIANAE